MIPFNNLRPMHEPIQADILSAVKRVYDRNVFIAGPEVEAFEAEWAAYCGQRYCVTCASGTDALTLLAKSATIGGAHLQANSLPCAKMGLERGLRQLVIDDVDERGHGILQSWFVVHTLLYGRFPPPVLMKHCGLFDGAQAHGWRPPADSTVAWSFYPTKNLGAFGDAGAVTTDDPEVCQKMREILNIQHTDGLRMQSRMDELQAAILRTKLPHLDRWNSERLQLAIAYWEHLPDWATPVCAHDEPSTHHLFAVLVDDRDRLRDHLGRQGIETKVHYPNPLSPLPGAERWCSRVLSLPLWVGMKREQVRTVCDAMKAFAMRGVA